MVIIKIVEGTVVPVVRCSIGDDSTQFTSHSMPHHYDDINISNRDNYVIYCTICLASFTKWLIGMRY